MTAEVLAEYENIYKAMVGELPYAAGLYIGRNMRISMVNQAILDMWGKDWSVIGKNYKDILPELEGQPIFQLYDDVFSSGNSYTAIEKEVYLKRHGILEPFYFNFTYKPLKDKEDTVWAILTTAVDVTELVITKRNLGQARADVRFALDAAELGTWVLDPVTERVNWDIRCRELHGIHVEDIVSYDSVISSIYPADQERIREAVAKAVSPIGGGSFQASYRVAINGQIRWLRNIGKAYFNDQNICYRFAGTTQDVTEEKILQLEQKKFLTLVENTQDFVGVTNLRGEVTYLNKAGQELVGLDDPKAYQRPAIEYMVTKDLVKVRDSLTAALKGEGTYTGEILYKHFKTGENIPCQINIFLLKDEETGEPIGMACVARDLRMEKARRKDQRKLLTLVENSADMMSVLEHSGFNSYVNKAGRELIGLRDEQEVLNTHISQLHRPQDFEFVQQEVLDSIKNKGRWAGKMIIKHFITGELIPVFNSTARIDDPVTGEPIAIGATMRDLRPEIAAQKALTESEELFRGITTAAPTALWVINENQEITFLNQTWADWTDTTVDQDINLNWINSIFKDDRQMAAKKFSDDFEARQKHENQFRITNAAGDIKWVICTGNPQYRADKTFSGYIGACVDITELKQLQNQKDEFIGIASHELKTPVTSIKAYAQVLESMFRRDGDLRKAEMLNKMDKQVNRLTNLISDLLDVTRLQAGKIEYHSSVFNLNQLAQELAEDLRHTTEKHQLILRQEENPVLINADRERIGQVIINFISNAIKYAPERGDIIISTKRDGANVIFSVQDFGIGIPADKKDKVFEQFYRVKNNNEQTFPGLGLGLYISSEIIKREGGKIWVESDEGKGSSFCFSLSGEV